MDVNIQFANSNTSDLETYTFKDSSASHVLIIGKDGSSDST